MRYGSLCVGIFREEFPRGRSYFAWACLGKSYKRYKEFYSHGDILGSVSMRYGLICVKIFMEEFL